MVSRLESRGVRESSFLKVCFLGVSRNTESGAFNRLNASVLLAKVTVKCLQETLRKSRQLGNYPRTAAMLKHTSGHIVGKRLSA